MPTQKMVNRRLEMEGSTALPANPWSGLFEGAKLASKGTTLHFLAPVVKDGRKIAQLQQSELDVLTEKWNASIVMYVVGSTPTIASVNRYIFEKVNSKLIRIVVIHLQESRLSPILMRILVMILKVIRI